MTACVICCVLCACSDEGRPSGVGQAQAASAAAILPAARASRYVKFVALSEWSGKAFTAMAEFDLIDVTGATVDRKRWIVSADSSDISDLPANAIDGDPKTLWHSRWQETVAPLPHTFTVDLGSPLKLSAFRYLPRQDATTNGTIGEYRLYVSDDGVEWGEAVASGDFRSTGTALGEKLVAFAARTPNHAPMMTTPQAQSTPMGQRASLALRATDPDSDPLSYSAEGLPPGLALAPTTGVISGTPITAGRHLLQIKVTDNKGLSATAALEWVVTPPEPAPDMAGPVAGEVRFVKLEEVSELNGKVWASVAEFNVLDAKGAVVPRTGWVASADSADASDQPQNAIDGNAATIWHSQWDGVAPPPPHSLVVDLRRYMRVGGFKVLPRQDKLSNGVIAQYRFFTSVDGVTWGQPLAEGDFTSMGKVDSEKTVRLR